MSEPTIFHDKDLWLAALETARRRAPVPSASVETPIAQPRNAQVRRMPKIEQSTTTTTNQGENPVKSQTETVEVQRVALDPVEARVDRLRNLNEHLIDRYLELAVALHEEHESQLWALTGGRYQSEEDFWEEAVGVKRRTAYQLIAVGGVLAEVSEATGKPTTPAIQAEATKVLTPVGLHKLDVITPVLKKEPTLPVVRKWSDLAKTNSREALREMVAKALGRKLRDEAEPGEKFRRYVINAMPDGESRELATEFFEVGERHTKSNPVGALICAMQEVLVEWSQTKAEEPAA